MGPFARSSFAEPALRVSFIHLTSEPERSSRRILWEHMKNAKLLCRLPQVTITNVKPPSITKPKSRSTFQRLLYALTTAHHFVLERFHAGKDVPEPKKVAVQKGLRTAFLAGWIHLIPVAGTCIISALNLKGHYIGKELSGSTGYDDQKLLGLQFAAKLHELTITASLTTVLFGLIRHMLINTGGLPFGALFAGFQFRDVSFLYSMEFWGTFLAKLDASRRRWVLIGLIVSCTFLSVSVGPSSATLMRPRRDDWPAGGTDFWINLPEEDLWSTNVTSSQVRSSCAVDTGDPDCPHSHWQTIAENYMSYWHFIRLNDYPLPFGFTMPGHKSVRTLVATTRSPLLVNSQSFTVATIPSYSLAYGLAEVARLWHSAATNLRGKVPWRFWSLNDAIYTLEAQQPVVQARCLQFNASNFGAHVSEKYHTQNGSVPFYDLSDLQLYNTTGDFSVSNALLFGSSPFASILQAANASSSPKILWVADVVQTLGQPALGAILTIPQNNQYEAQLYSCTIDARMARAAIRSDKTVGQIIVQGFVQDNLADPQYTAITLQTFGTYGSGNTWPQISINQTWATEYLNPIIASDNTTVFGSIMSMAGLWNTSQVLDKTDALYAVESLLATTIVNGVSRRDYGGEFSGTLKGAPGGLNLQTTNTTESLECAEWCTQIMPSHGRPMGYGGHAFDTSTSEQQNSTKFTVRVEANGYAFSSRGNTAKFAIAVLYLHMLIAVAHWSYTLYRKESSSSWDSIAELVALAMRSAPSETFVNTGAGIDSIDNFKKRTLVVERDGRLQLAVDVPPDRYPTLKPNELYG